MEDKTDGIIETLLEELSSRLKINTIGDRGVTTVAQLCKEYTKKKKLIHDPSFDVDLDGWREIFLSNFDGSEVWPWPSSDPVQLPTMRTAEKGIGGTQEFMDSILTAITASSEDGYATFYPRCKTGTNRGFIKKGVKVQLQSIPAPCQSEAPSFKTRKPDIVCYDGRRRGAYSITMHGDMKKTKESGTSDSEFSDEEIGHIIDLNDVFLRVQEYRFMTFSLLSDGYRFQFFKFEKKGGGDLFVTKSRIYTGFDGWQIFFSLLYVDLSVLGYQQYLLEGYEVVNYLGSGLTSLVFEVKSTESGKKYTAKIAKDEFNLEKEEMNLKMIASEETLKNNICHVHAMAATTTSKQALILWPVGYRVVPLKNGHFIHGGHIKQLTYLISTLHKRGFAHRDIKPQNMYVYDDNIILNDFGSCQPLSFTGPWEGTKEYGDCPSESTETYTLVQADLRSLVRACFVMITGEEPPPKEGYKQFWDHVFSRDTVWSEALRLASSAEPNYLDLATLIARVK